MPSENAETTKIAEKLDFVGDWKTKAGQLAKVEKLVCGFWLGWVQVDIICIPTYWDTEGNSRVDSLSLDIRRRPAEYWS